MLPKVIQSLTSKFFEAVPVEMLEYIKKARNIRKYGILTIPIQSVDPLPYAGEYLPWMMVVYDSL